MDRALPILALFVASCGSVRPASPPIVVDEAAELSTRLSAVEGRPAGVVLRLESSTPDVTSLELYRVVTGGEPTLLQALDLDEQLRASVAQGLEIVDSTVRAGQELTYQLFAVGEGDAVLARSELTTVSWSAPPPRPLGLSAVAPFSDVVELSWQAPGSHGAIIFRRDVLAGTGFERVAIVEPPARDWVDRNVVSAGVYSYRIALSRQTNGFVQFGAPSEEVYASTPETR